MKAIVFGASGYLGSHVAEQLVLDDHEVVCVLRPGSDTTFLKTLSVSIVHFNFNEMSALSELIDLGDSVFNCVAETRMHLSDKDRRRVECELTSTIFFAAQRAGARRFIQLSTVMVYGFDRPHYPVDELHPLTPRYSYSRVAYEREQVLIDQCKQGGTELLILRPSNTFGRRDSSALPALLASHKKGVFPVISGGGWQFSCMDGRDVGRAMVHLLDVPARLGEAEIFLAKGFDTTWLEVKFMLDEILGRDTKLMSLPKGLGILLGGLIEILYPYGRQPPLTRFNVDLLSTHTLFDDAKFRATGFQSRYDLRASLCDGLTGEAKY